MTVFSETSPAKIDRSTFVQCWCLISKVKATNQQYIYQPKLEGPWGLFAWSHQGPKILHKQLCLVKGRLKDTQHTHPVINTEKHSSYTTAYNNTSSLGLSAELSSPLSQHMSGWVCLSPCLPATVATAGERLCPANCLASHTQTLSRNPLSYCFRSLPLKWKNSRIKEGCV